MQTYKQYLKTAFRSVVESTLKDQSLTVLSEMENKNFYFTRIHELFSELYSVQRENKIKQLIQQVEKLKVSQSNLRHEQSLEEINAQISCRNCLQKCREESEKTAYQKKYPIQSVHLAIKQNQKLRQQLKECSQLHLLEIKNLSKIHEAAQSKLNQQINDLNLKQEEMEKKYNELRSNLTTEIQGKQQIRKQLHDLKEQNMSLVLKSREMEKGKKGQSQEFNKLRQETVNLRQTNELLGDKIKRLEDMNTHHKNKLSFYEQEIKDIANASSDSQPKATNKRQQNIDQIRKQQDIDRLVHSLTTKQLQIKKLMKQKLTLTQQKYELEQQMNDYKLHSQKTINQLKQNLQTVKFEFQKQLGSYRDNEKVNFMELRKIQADKKLNQIDQLKERIREADADKYKFENKIAKLEHSNLVLVQNYQQITQAFRQQKSMFDSKIQQYQKTLQDSKRLERQLGKVAEINYSKSTSLEKELRDKIKFYEQKMSYLQSKLQESQKLEEKLHRNIQKLEKEQRTRNSMQTNRVSLLRQNELNLKVSELQRILQESEGTSKQIIDRKQEKIRSLNKQIQCYRQKITQLSLNLEQESKQNVELSRTLRETEKLLRQQQQKLSTTQQRNRNQTIELMKNFEIKTEQLTEQLTKHYTSTTNIKKDLIDKSSIGQSLKCLEQEYKIKIRQSEEEWSVLKSTNIKLEDKIKEYEQKFKKLHQNYKKVNEELTQVKNRESKFECILQEQKNNQISIVKYYEEKINTFKFLFRQFKFQICQQFKQTIMLLKAQVCELKKQIQKYQQLERKSVLSIKAQIEKKIINYESTIQGKLDDKNRRFLDESSRVVEKQKQELINKYENKLKQRQMTIMAIAAEKQFQFEQLKESESILSKKLKELEGMYTKVAMKLQKNEKNEVQLKQIITKMEIKVDEAQRGYLIKQKQVICLQQLVEQLSEKLQKADKNYRQQIKECRQKYREQNEKLFGKYEREFNKIIALNSKKAKQKPSLISIMSARTLTIPTKGNEEDKIQKLKRQIQEQKKIVHQLQNQKSF